MKHDRPVLGVGARAGPREGKLGRKEEREEEQRRRGWADGGWGWGPAISTPGPRNVPTLTKKKR